MQTILNLFPLPNVSGFGPNQNYNYSNAFSAQAPRREDVLRSRLSGQRPTTVSMDGGFTTRSRTGSVRELPRTVRHLCVFVGDQFQRRLHAESSGMERFREPGQHAHSIIAE